MKISNRIYKIAECVNPGETVADIGTDHGYVPMLLVKNRISPRVIMSDISSGSLAKAVETFELSGLSAEVDDNCFRVGDGFETIDYGETDAAIIAGLGGHTIVDILDSDICKSKSFKKLILQPRKHSGTLRHYLQTHCWDIANELLAEEGKFACEIITAVPAEGYKAEDVREALYPPEDIRWKYPEGLVTADPSLALKRIDWKLESLREQADNLYRSEGDHHMLLRKMKDDYDYLIVLEDWAKKSLK